MSVLYALDARYKGRVMRTAVNSHGPEVAPGLRQLLFDAESGGQMERLTTDIGLA